MKPIQGPNRFLSSPRLKDAAESTGVKPVPKDEIPALQEELYVASRGALEAYGKAEPTRENRRKLGRALSAANRISAYSIAANQGVLGPVGIAYLAAEVKREALELSNFKLDKNARVSSVETSPGSKNKAQTEWVDVPAGEFLFGPEKTKQELAAYRISKYPVTNRDFQQFVADTGYETQGNWQPPKDGYSEKSKEGNKPCVHVTFHDAKAYAKWAGGRLPTEQEWEKAARGTDGRLYPWGNEWRPEACNNEGSGLTTVDAHEKAGNVSPFGAVDMVGNAMEWVDSGTTRRPGAVLLKGGAWQNYRAPGADQLADAFGTVRHTSEYPDSTYAGFGFRIVTDEVPDKASGQAKPTSSPTPARKPVASLGELNKLEPTGPFTPDQGLSHEPPLDILTSVDMFSEPKPQQEEDGRLEDKIKKALARLSEGLSDTQNAPTNQLKNLSKVMRTAREMRPLGGSSDTKDVRDASNVLQGTANQLATLVGAASSGHVPLAAALSQLNDHQKKMVESAQVLDATPKTTLATDSDKKPADYLFDWIDVPAGKALVGRDNREVHLDDFQISKHPVTNDQFREFVESTEYEVEGGWRPPSDGQFESREHARLPVVDVSHNDARAFCEWAGCRLPEEEEWEKVARGTDGYTPKMNFVPSMVAAENGFMEPVDAISDDSPFGASGMIGNALEWVEGTTERRPGSVLLKGGAWSNGGTKPFTPERHSTDLPNSSYGGFGFRVARSSRPAS